MTGSSAHCWFHLLKQADSGNQQGMEKPNIKPAWITKLNYMKHVNIYELQCMKLYVSICIDYMYTTVLVGCLAILNMITHQTVNINICVYTTGSECDKTSPWKCMKSITAYSMPNV